MLKTMIIICAKMNRLWNLEFLAYAFCASGFVPKDISSDSTYGSTDAKLFSVAQQNCNKAQPAHQNGLQVELERWLSLETSSCRRMQV